MNPQEIPNHLVKAIVVTLCCCLPLGVVSIVFAAQVNGKVAEGNYEEATRLSNQADLWANIGIIGGLIAIAIQVAIMVLGGGLGALQN
jgi:hypothetical protein